MGVKLGLSLIHWSVTLKEACVLRAFENKMLGGGGVYEAEKRK
jgi:hypothetical protein